MIQQFISAELVLFAVNGGCCHLKTGDRFDAETVIGESTWENRPVIAGFAGQIEAIGYDGRNYGLAILARRAEGNGGARLPIRLFKVSTRDCQLKLGDRVLAGHLIGRDTISGQPVYSDRTGWVEYLISNCASNTIALLVRAA